MTLDELIRQRDELDARIAIHRARSFGLITEELPCREPPTPNPPQADPSSEKESRPPRRVPYFGERRR